MLSDRDWLALREWAEEKVPWVSRGALGSVRTLEIYVDTVLDWGRSKGKRRPGWVATIRNWIRNDEYERLGRMAQNGDERARLALQNPVAWRDAFDRAHHATAALDAVSSTEGETIVRPAGGTVHTLRRPR